MHPLSCILLILVSTIAWAGEASMSSGFATQFACRDCFVRFESNLRKRFPSDAHLRAYMQNQQREFYTRLRTWLPRLRTIAADYRSKGVQAFRVDAPLVKLGRAGNVTFQHRVEAGTYQVVFTAAATAQLKGIQARLASVFAEDTPSTDEPLQTRTAERAVAQCGAVGTHGGLWTGALLKILEEDIDYFKSQVASLHHRMSSHLQHRFADPAWLKAFDEAPRLLAPALQAQGRRWDVDGFLPWGPFVTGPAPFLMRMRWERGFAVVVVMVAMDHEQAWGSVTRHLTEALDAFPAESALPVGSAG